MAYLYSLPIATYLSITEYLQVDIHIDIESCSQESNMGKGCGCETKGLLLSELLDLFS